MCKHWLQGQCPFGDGCHFAHGQEELAKHKAMNPKFAQSSAVQDGEIDADVFGESTHVTADYYEGNAVSGGR